MRFISQVVPRFIFSWLILEYNNSRSVFVVYIAVQDMALMSFQ